MKRVVHAEGATPTITGSGSSRLASSSPHAAGSARAGTARLLLLATSALLISACGGKGDAPPAEDPAEVTVTDVADSADVAKNDTASPTDEGSTPDEGQPPVDTGLPDVPPTELPDSEDTLDPPDVTVEPAPVAQVLDESGGEVEHSSGAALVVPAGALPAGVELTMEVQEAPAAVEALGEPLGPALVLGPSGQVFLVPVEIALPLDPDLVAGVDPAELQVVLSSEDGEFVGLETTFVNDEKGPRLLALTTHFSIAVPVKRVGPPLALVVPALPDAAFEEAYGPVTLSVTGGTPPYTFALAGGSLPPGLALTDDGFQGQLAGVPAQSGSFAPMVRVTDANGQKLDKALKLTVVGPPNPEPVLESIDPVSLPAGSGATVLTATGQGFAFGALILVDGKGLPTTRDSDLVLRATLPAATLATPGSHTVAVINPPAADGDGRSDALTFEVTVITSPDSDLADVLSPGDVPVDDDVAAPDTTTDQDTADTADPGDTTTACVPTVPPTEVCDGVDNDCDGQTDAVPCSDGDVCTLDDTCTAGACVATGSLDCDDGKPCTTDQCASAAGCTHTPAAGSCSDGSGCTVGDVCTGGDCVAGAPKACDDADDCTTDTCDASSGACVSTPIVGCGDNCLVPSDCADDGNPCTTAGCTLGQCTVTAAPGACDDGDLCTLDDACAAGACQGTALACDDGSPCTTDACVAGSCVTTPKDGGPCDDGNRCTVPDVCGSGLCLAGPPLVCDDDNVCTLDACDAATGCTASPQAGPCDDGDACTVDDACAGGACGGAPKVCEDGNECTLDTCSGGCQFLGIAGCGVDCTTDADCAAGDGPCVDSACGSGKCGATLLEGPCSDGDACTQGDTCAGGLCVGATPTSCDDADVCTDDACAPAIGCTHTHNTAPCSDGLQCTTNDTCAAGTCVGGAALPCDDGEQCTVDLCTEGAGCQHLDASGPCDDGAPCTLGELCQGGQCGGGTPKSCDDDLVCTTDQCQPATGACVSTPIPSCDEPCKVASDCDDGGNPCLAPVCLSGVCSVTPEPGTCDDGDACTLGDQCAAGSCVGTPKACDDGNPCTADACAGGACGFTPAAGPCNDGNACSTQDGCQGGSCVGGPALDCNDGEPCTDDSCAPASGCTTSANTKPCSDGQACTVGDSCAGGSCSVSSPKPCDDADACTTDTCAADTGSCVFTQVNGCGGYCATPSDCADDGDVCTAWECTAGRCAVAYTTSPCDDANHCTAGDVCAAGTCAGAAVVCNDGNPCTDDACAPASGCTAANNTRPCTDGAVCTVGDVCQDGACSPGAAASCDDHNGCTQDACDPVLGCRNTAQGLPCTDDNPCTVGDLCAAGTCVPGAATVCDDGNACTADHCSPASGACVSAPVVGCSTACIDDAGCPSSGNPCAALACVAGFCQLAPATSCSDGNACTTGDTCLGGLCRGENGACDDGNACTADVCNPATGCAHAPAQGTCEDGNACTVNDVCVVGVCTPGFAQQCVDGNPCTADACEPSTGCRFAPIAGPCDDGDGCTAFDSCAAGECAGGALAVCDDGDACTFDSCAAGACAATAIPGCGATCTVAADCQDDQNPCTMATCVAGACGVAAVDAACSDGSLCTRDDRCTEGQCAGVAVVCDDGNPCTDGACDPATGCSHAPHTRPCAADNMCVVDARCAGGVCVGASAAACDDGNPCTLDGCDPAAGCVHVDSALPCDDGDACTREDECGSGVCLGGTRVPCVDGKACTLDTCDSVTGQCVFTTIVGCGAACTTPASCADDGNPCTSAVCVSGACVSVFVSEPCDDGDACSLGDICLAGSCTGTASACDDGNACTTDACVNGACQSAARTGPCNDGSACTTGDACAQGVCTAGTLVSCDDGNPCSTDTCDAKLGCRATPNTAACSDGNPCTTGDSCASGACAAGAPKACDDGDDCTADRCAPESGLCSNAEVPGCGEACASAADCGEAPPCFESRCVAGACSLAWTAAPCDDGDACTTGDACVQGLCHGGPLGCDDGNACTTDSCAAASGCVHLPAKGACTDGDACTQGEQCTGGVCGGGTPVACQDANPCTDDTCQPEVGCVQVPNASACDDGNACTTGDACFDAYCVGTDALACSDDNPCTADGCSTASGCVHAPRAGKCSDGNACTAGDACQAGSCAPGAAVVCDDGSVCTADSCAPATGCVTTPVEGLCDDGDACSAGDRCVQGYCMGDTVQSCDDELPCTHDTCLPGSGCVNTLFTGPCDDGDACTTGELCASGACAGGTAKSCDDQNPCTDDSCSSTAGCLHTLNAAPCSDGQPCTGPDVCKVGQCSPGPSVACDDQNACTSETCVAGVGCQYTMLTVACDDGSVCTSGDVCANGACVSGAPISCEDDNACTTDTCGPVAGCAHTNNAAPCDDASVCTTSDVCSGGLCSGTALSCDDNNPCTDDRCDPITGCANEPTSALCTDNDACTTGDTCVAGDCVGSPRVCDDGEPCTIDDCDVLGGCSFVPSSAPCNDGDACTVGDRCAAGACAAGAAKSCDDGNTCTTDSCAPSTGCVHQPASGGCDDGDVCTWGDTCLAGACSGVPDDCDDGKACTTDLCVPVTGCTSAPRTGACEDGNACTSNDTCQDGYCLSGTQRACDDDNPCTTDGCNAASGCTTTPNTAACADGDACTTDDTCALGVCAGVARTCDDENPCTTDTCVTGAGCTYVAVADAIVCDAGDPCITGGMCAAGVCIGAPPSCDDGVACTLDTCVHGSGCAHVATNGLCNDGMPCTADSCNTATGCVFVPVANGSACTPLDDGCPTSPQCQAGVCSSTGPTPKWWLQTNVNGAYVTSVTPMGSGALVTRTSGGGASGAVSKIDKNGVVEWTYTRYQDINQARVTSNGQVVWVGERGGAAIGLLSASGVPVWTLPADGSPPWNAPPCVAGKDVVETPSGFVMQCEYNGTAAYRFVSFTGEVTATKEIPRDADLSQMSLRRLIRSGSHLLSFGYVQTTSGVDWAYVRCTDLEGNLISQVRYTSPARFADAAATSTGAVALTMTMPAELVWFDPGTNPSNCGYSGYGRINVDGWGVPGLYPPTALAAVNDNIFLVGSGRRPSGVVRAYVGEFHKNGSRNWSIEYPGMGEVRGIAKVGDGIVAGSYWGDPSGTLTIRTDLSGNGSTAAPTCTTAANCSGALCNDGVACTIDSCNSATGCVYTPSNALCDDGDACTTDACSATTGCSHSPVPPCNDGNACTTDTCKPATGCAFAAVSGACSDGNACTLNDQCASGACAAGVQRSCNDGVACTSDSCNAATGCVHTPSNAACDDGKLCTTNTCNATTGCVFTASTAACNDGKVCTDDVCDETAGCSNPNNVAACDDGNACTLGDACVGGTCLGGAARVCDDLNPCTTDACNPTTGCSVTNLADGTGCPTKLTCATQATCSSGVCNDNPNTLAYYSRAVEGSSAYMLGHNAFVVLPGPDYDMVFLRVRSNGGFWNSTIVRTNALGQTIWTIDVENVALESIGYANNEIVLGGALPDNSFVVQKRNPSNGSLKGSYSRNIGGAGASVTDLLYVNDFWLGSVRVLANGSWDAWTFSQDYLGGFGDVQPRLTGSGFDVITDLYWSGALAWVGYTSSSGAGSNDGFYQIAGNPLRLLGGSMDDRLTAASYGPGGIMWGAGSTQIDGNGNRRAFIARLDGSTQMLQFSGFSNNVGEVGLTSDGTSLFAAGGSHFAKLDGSANVQWLSSPGGASRFTRLAMANGNTTLVGFSPFGANTWLTKTDNGGVAGCSGTNVCANLTPGQCDDGITCTADFCQVGVGCIHTPVDGACDDGNLCTLDQCSVTQGCVYPVTQQNVCNDNDICTLDTCDVASKKCVYSTNPAACSDGNACTQDLCVKGQGCQFSSGTCDDGNECTTDTCNPATGCQAVHRVGAACDDGAACTVFDRCATVNAQAVCQGTETCGVPVTNGLLLNLHASKDGAVEKDAQNKVLSWSGTGHASMGDPFQRPTFVPSALGPERDAIDCSFGYLQATASPTGEATVFLVHDQPASHPLPGTLFAWGGVELLNSSGTYILRASSSPTPLTSVASVAGLQVVVLRVSSTVAELLHHSAGGIVIKQAPPVPLSTSNVGSTIYLGGRTERSRARFGQVLVYDRVLSAAETAATTTWLKAQWGFEACVVSADCNDGNGCTQDSCETVGGTRTCTYQYLNLPDICVDGDACTLTHTCLNGNCIGSTVKNCEDGAPCTLDTCDRHTGACSHQLADGLPCDDGNACTYYDMCRDGACVRYNLECDDQNPCTTDSCSPASGCVFSANTLPCDDLDTCTGPDVCAGKVCSGPHNSAPCNDGDACTLGDTCQNGACTLSTPVVCTDVDNNKCTLETCHPATGCKATGATVCNDGNACTDDSCSAAAGGCVYTPNAAACSDGSVCSVGDACFAGACKGGVLLPCDDGNSCTADSCNASTGCVFTPSTECDDGSTCTAGDFCVFGSCLPGAPLDCDDGNDCTVDYCDGRLGCLHLDETSGTACSDGDACTQGDTCQAGACAPGAEICDYAVTTTADSGPGSLRSHLDFGPVTPTGVVTIKIMVDGLLRLKSPLPLLRGEFVIDGEGRTFLIDGDGQHRAFASVNNLTLKNLKIQNAASTLTTGLGPGRGGAVYVNDTDEFDTDVPKLVVEDCTFYNNFAREAGGAIYAEKANVTVVRSLFSLNGRNEQSPTAPGGDPLQGGAVSIWSVPNSGVDATFDDVRFEYNMGAGRGAALWCGWYTTCDVKRSSFYGNKAYQGVFASAYAAESTLTNVSFISNEGWDVGGAIFGDGTLSLNHVTVAANNSIDALKWPTVYVDGLTKIVNSVIAENGPNKKTLACLKGPNATLQVTSSTIAPRLTPGTPTNYGPVGSVADCVASTGAPAQLGPPKFEASERTDLPITNWVMRPLQGASTMDSANLPLCLGKTGGMDQSGTPRPQGAGCDRGAAEVPQL